MIVLSISVFTKRGRGLSSYQVSFWVLHSWVWRSNERDPKGDVGTEPSRVGAAIRLQSCIDTAQDRV